MKYKKEQFEKDYKQALNLISELDYLLDTIIIDVQYDHIPNGDVAEEIRPLQMRLLQKLANKAPNSFQRTLDEVVFNLKEIKEKKCEV
jgi:hypothetical protein